MNFTGGAELALYRLVHFTTATWATENLWTTPSHLKNQPSFIKEIMFFFTSRYNGWDNLRDFDNFVSHGDHYSLKASAALTIFTKTGAKFLFVFQSVTSSTFFDRKKFPYISEFFVMNQTTGWQNIYYQIIFYKLVQETHKYFPVLECRFHTLFRDLLLG